MSIYEPLGTALARVASESGGFWAFSVTAMPNKRDNFSFHPYNRLFAGSLAQLGLAAYLLRLIQQAQDGDRSDLERFDYAYELELRANHKVDAGGRRIGGTGILQLFPNGFRLPLLVVLKLMLVESDNVAAKMLMEHCGGQEVVRKWLVGQRVPNPGLGIRSGAPATMFLPGLTDVESVERILDLFIGERRRVLRNMLARGHHSDGMTRVLAPGYKVSPTAASVTRAMVLRRLQTWRWPGLGESMINAIITRPGRPHLAMKEALVPGYDGGDIRHLAGLVDWPNGSGTARIVLLTQGVVHKDGFARFGREVLSRLR